jgi:ribosomal-protein-alanine N-acetyltransferase
MEIRPATAAQLDEVVDIFAAAFYDSISFFTPLNQKIKVALKDFFKLLLSAFGPGFMVAIEDNQVAGYIVMAADIRQLWLHAVLSGFILKLAAKAIGGAYGVRLATIYKIVQNKLYYMRFEVTTDHCGQLLSLGVTPKYQGRGMGRQLITAGINYLAAQKVNRIKLEVRPDNTAAAHLYASFDFVPIGQAKDLQGQWIVMMKEISPHS